MKQRLVRWLFPSMDTRQDWLELAGALVFVMAIGLYLSTTSINTAPYLAVCFALGGAAGLIAGYRARKRRRRRELADAILKRFFPFTNQEVTDGDHSDSDHS